ncbi:DUF6278 family protein [Prescottella equi]|uniref:DUF6278 family protein n=1 Tax=Rhodococcus hoagii TaxID=43767 RepID=UPI00111C52D2|nr:DUF6278 family protein [Prescottella equi]NKR39684.1 hypothetical protein [Prescottella equi]NKR72506.1 hypothetical protein [Prescottella equi]NKS15996.1 hypothetical protein [Prescottella equi]
MPRWRRTMPHTENWLDMTLSTSVSSRLPLVVQRLLKIGPRYGIARGIVLYGPGPSGGVLDARSPLLEPTELWKWLADHDEPHDHTADTVAATECCLPQLHNDPELRHQLSTQIGLLLGQTLTHTNRDTYWTLWPNGHPVVRTPTTDLDVTDAAHNYLTGHGPTPTAILSIHTP